MSDAIPVVPGFRLDRDPLTDEWIATSPSGFVIRGWSQRELTEARWALWRQILDNFRVALAEVYPTDASLQNPAQPPDPWLRGLTGRVSRSQEGRDETRTQGTGGSPRAAGRPSVRWGGHRQVVMDAAVSIGHPVGRLRSRRVSAYVGRAPRRPSPIHKGR